MVGAVYFNRDKDDHAFRVLVDGTLDSTFNSGYQSWSDPSEANWIFDGRMDACVADRTEAFGSGFTDIGATSFQAASSG